MAARQGRSGPDPAVSGRAARGRRLGPGARGAQGGRAGSRPQRPLLRGCGCSALPPAPTFQGGCGDARAAAALLLPHATELPGFPTPPRENFLWPVGFCGQGAGAGRDEMKVAQARSLRSSEGSGAHGGPSPDHITPPPPREQGPAWGGGWGFCCGGAGPLLMDFITQAQRDCKAFYQEEGVWHSAPPQLSSLSPP